jgi:hypothetical protein
VSELSATMTAALKHAESHGGLVRQPGGFWVAPQDERDYRPRVYFGTSTVAGLVKRGLLAYIEHREGRNGRFPIRASKATGEPQP